MTTVSIYQTNTMSLSDYLNFQANVIDASAEFTEAFTERFARDIQAGIDSQVAVKNALIDANRAQGQKFLEFYSASNSLSSPTLRAAANDAGLESLRLANSLESAIGPIDQQVATHIGEGVEKWGQSRLSRSVG